MSPVTQAIIIGGGPAGLAAALNLKRTNGIDCRIYEIRDKPTTIGGAVNIPPNGIRLFDQLGLLNAMNARASSSSSLIKLHQGDSIIAEKNAGEVSKGATGYGFWRIVRTDMLEVLLSAIEQEDIPIMYGKKITKVTETENSVEVLFSDGTRDSAGLLLGCDGIHSSVRRLHVDPMVEPVYSGISNIGTILPSSKVAFRLDPALHMTFTSDGLFGFTQCNNSGDRLYWFCSKKVSIPENGDNRDGWEAFGKNVIEGFKSDTLKVLSPVQGQWGDQLRETVKATESISFFPIFKLPPTSKWSTKRCLLLGDAAHAMQPHVGQGTSMALEDAFMLSRLLEAYNETKELSDIFKVYEEKRRPRVEALSQAAAASGNVRSKENPNAPQSREEVLMAQWRDGTRLQDSFYNILEEPI
ncbi:hypothetical protein N7462_010314 [Penicillium macrosclerotiorum]|uniref:uncharacterized protein n=1 Tax=Penicillium macrosclerotiorum TaxID=303699 RepID=UPI002549261D|nr:uncharacterized protein N7462_010314 [Penicillium macrosclerotiorum]KAJ5669244.1 hypothetical protein N7462_010314 [Penicillium macrosclerotiorum]